MNTKKLINSITDVEACNFDDLKGFVFSHVIEKDDVIYFFALGCAGGFMLHHEQECCERVTIESIVGDLDDLIDCPILLSEETYDDNYIIESDIICHEGDAQEWTFYTIATKKGYVTVRFVGESNGYYSVGVTCSIFDTD